MVNAIIHSVADENEIRIGVFQNSIEAFVNMGTRVGMIFFAVATGGFAVEFEIDDIKFPVRVCRPQPGLDESGIQSGLSDAVTDEKDLVAAL